MLGEGGCRWRLLFLGGDKDFFTLNLPEYTEQKIGKIQRLWTDFYFILTDIKESMVDYINIKDRTEIWLHLFLEVIIF